MATLWLFILIGATIYFFWLNRKIAESAQLHAKNQAEKLQVQLLDVACKRRRLGLLRTGKPGLKSTFIFDFSSDGESRYQAELEMEDIKLVNVAIPPHKI
ncbi:DUF3301 domain-containing protein [Pseudoalteromonas denitrificans]|jgi:hypothetical protein|uniref:DUF3301 domain-containing protein n=1 Tax=Pseudoalteromonas denitrificans DSM 6059 TaxID=1123010 RepID=A0A1I1MHH0_9GAMM|nr:DUF3301 domain-containing protein [Pseudoalteromonas denitrificans]SFC84857.1 Protein of unknown function [Pseudoalteromonas denitrificans DSM 6059]